MLMNHTEDNGCDEWTWCTLLPPVVVNTAVFGLCYVNWKSTASTEQPNVGKRKNADRKLYIVYVYLAYCRFSVHVFVPTGLGVWCVCGGRQPSGMDLHPLWLWQQWESYKGGMFNLPLLSLSLFCTCAPWCTVYFRLPLLILIACPFQILHVKCRPTVQTVFFPSLQDMSSLMHTIYDVVDASVNQSCHNKSKTLRVKLTVTPEPRSHRRETGTGKWQ